MDLVAHRESRLSLKFAYRIPSLSLFAIAALILSLKRADQVEGEARFVGCLQTIGFLGGLGGEVKLQMLPFWRGALARIDPLVSA